MRRDSGSGARSRFARTPGAIVLFNPLASRADRTVLLEALDRVFGANGYTLVDTEAHHDRHQALDRALARARSRGCDLAIAAGGDGTISLLAGRLVRAGSRASMVLGIVPLGTANVLARDLGVPFDVEAALRLAAERPRVMALDSIQLGDRRFLTQVGIGLDAKMIDGTSRSSQIQHGRLAYLVALVKEAIGHRAARFVLDIDGRVIRLRAWDVVLANAGTLGAPPFTWGPGIDPADGKLDLCVFNVRSLGDYLSLAYRLVARRHRADERARYFRVRERVSIRASRSLPVQGDGERIDWTPVTLRLDRSSVRIVVPREPEAAAPVGNGAARIADAARPSTSDPRPTSLVARAPRRRTGLERRIARLDSLAYLRINRLHRHGFVDQMMVAVSRLVDHGEAWGIAAILAGLGDPTRGLKIPIVVLLPLWLTSLTVNYPIKSYFRRHRPFITHTDARVIGRRPRDSSFPSGHTASAFAGAVLLTPFLLPLAPALYLYAFLVAVSRVFLGVHYPSDVVIGAATGAVLGAIYGALFRMVIPV